MDVMVASMARSLALLPLPLFDSVLLPNDSAHLNGHALVISSVVRPTQHVQGIQQQLAGSQCLKQQPSSAALRRSLHHLGAGRAAVPGPEGRGGSRQAA